jgi:hypothetical protein
MAKSPKVAVAAANSKTQKRKDVQVAGYLIPASCWESIS